jgi:hypothetical protein
MVTATTFHCYCYYYYFLLWDNYCLVSLHVIARLAFSNQTHSSTKAVIILTAQVQQGYRDEGNQATHLTA